MPLLPFPALGDASKLRSGGGVDASTPSSSSSAKHAREGRTVGKHLFSSCSWLRWNSTRHAEASQPWLRASPQLVPSSDSQIFRRVPFVWVLELPLRLVQDQPANHRRRLAGLRAIAIVRVSVQPAQ